VCSNTPNINTDTKWSHKQQLNIVAVFIGVFFYVVSVLEMKQKDVHHALNGRSFIFLRNTKFHRSPIFFVFFARFQIFLRNNG